ncbi:MAG: DUF1292 domain-containing protein [Lachnospiraceae bacterium]|nr:DUF1292 domain-containing protein [Lachnospiraceae bacterium]
MEKNEKIVFETAEGDIEFYVLEQTMIAGKNYILVTDDLESEEGSFVVLKEEMVTNPKDNEEIATYGVIEDENELKAVIKVFDELLEDIDLEV